MHAVRRFTTAVVLAAAVGLCLASCGSGDSGPATTGSAPDGGGKAGRHLAVRSGGSLTYALDEPIRGFNINTSADVSFGLQEVENLVLPRVFTVDDKLRPELDTAVVRSTSRPSDTSVVYDINPKATWADGEPIDAEDFYYLWAAQSGNPRFTDIDHKAFDDATNSGYDLITSVAGSSPAGGASCTTAEITGIGQIPCANGKVVTVRFSAPYADWRALFSDLLPAHVAAKFGWNTGFDDAARLVSGGPYEIDKYVANQYVVLRRNPHYFGAPGKLETITFQIFNGDSQLVSAMKNHEVDVISPLNLDASIVEEARQLTGVHTSLIGGLKFQHVDFNEADFYLAERKVRQAIADGTDRAEILKRTVGEYDPSISVMDNRMFAPGQPGYVANGAAYDRVRPNAARALLSSLGMTMGPGGYFRPRRGPQAGKDLTFSIRSTAGDPLRADIEQLFQADMAAIGVKVTIANTDANTLFGDLVHGDYQLALFGWATTPYLSGNEPVYCSYTLGPACGENWLHYANHRVDAALRAGATAISTRAERSDFNTADRLLWADMATLPLFQQPVLTVWSDRFANIVPTAAAVGITWNAQEWGVKAS